MIDNSSWVDSVIKQHRKRIHKKINYIELKELKEFKNSEIGNTQISNIFSSFSNRNFPENNFSYQPPEIYTHTSFNESNVHQEIKYPKPERVIRTHQSDFPYNPSQNSKEEELKEKLKSKKERILLLEKELETLKAQNESLQEKSNNIQNFELMIDELNNKIKELEEEKSKNNSKINRYENIKNQEVELMNQKIRDYETIIDKNSKDYLIEINKLKSQLEENQKKLIEQEKQLDIVNFFIHKMNNKMGTEQKEINDRNKLQEKLVEIEEFFLKENLRVNNEEIKLNESNKEEVNNMIGDVFKKLEIRMDSLEKDIKSMQKRKKTFKNKSILDNKMMNKNNEVLRSYSLGKFKGEMARDKMINVKEKKKQEKKKTNL